MRACSRAYWEAAVDAFVHSPSWAQTPHMYVESAHPVGPDNGVNTGLTTGGSVTGGLNTGGLNTGGLNTYGTGCGQ